MRLLHRQHPPQDIIRRIRHIAFRVLAGFARRRHLPGRRVHVPEETGRQDAIGDHVRSEAICETVPRDGLSSGQTHPDTSGNLCVPIRRPGRIVRLHADVPATSGGADRQVSRRVGRGDQRPLEP